MERMGRLRRSLRDSFRKKRDSPESSKPHQWQADEEAVKAGNCSFPVKVCLKERSKTYDFSLDSLFVRMAHNAIWNYMKTFYCLPLSVFTKLLDYH